MLAPARTFSMNALSSGSTELVATELVEASTFAVLGAEREELLEGPVGGPDVQLAVEDDEALADGVDDRLGIPARVGEALGAALHGVDVEARR